MRSAGSVAMSGTGIRPRRKAWRLPRFFVRPGACWGALLTTLVLIVMAIGTVYTPDAPTDLIGAPFEGPSNYAWLGTDAVGRDVLSRVMCGGGVILSMSALAALLGVVLGGLLGISAGYIGGLADDAIMRVMDVLLAFPQTILALLFVSVLGSSFWLIVILVAAIHAPQVARVIRAASLRAAGEDYVRYARAVGLPRRQIITREILPNVLSPLLVEIGLRFTFSIALIAGLSFLGLAQNPPAANWGLMVNENRIGILQNPWPVVAPILLIAALTVGINLLTDAYARYAAGAPRGSNAMPDDALAVEDRALSLLNEREAL
jgi:peptide/nickel transport system permease protein